MKTLDACCKAFNWQGGTIHGAIARVLKTGNIGTSTYMLGLRMGLDEERNNVLADIDIPINSFGNLETQVPDYILGLINSGVK